MQILYVINKRLEASDTVRVVNLKMLAGAYEHSWSTVINLDVCTEYDGIVSSIEAAVDEMCPEYSDLDLKQVDLKGLKDVRN